nr:uncharacterized protein LOC126530588 isoform X3 [Dermacentor andersoni]
MFYALAFAVSSSGLKWDASPSLVRKCLQNLPGLLRPSRASEKSLRYWREQTAGQVGMAMHLGEQYSNCESLVVSQNFVLCQDGLTPCHLMLSLSGLTGISRPSGSAHIWGVLNACFTSASGWPGIALSSGSAHRMKNCWSMRGCYLPDPHHRQLHCKKSGLAHGK